MTTKTYGGYTVEQLREMDHNNRPIKYGVLLPIIRDLLNAVESGEREVSAAADRFDAGETLICAKCKSQIPGVHTGACRATVGRFADNKDE